MARKNSAGTATASPAPIGPDKDWEAEQDLHTLTRAEDIRADGGRMKRVLGVHKKQMRSLGRVAKTLRPPSMGRSR